ncbi:Tab2/Atab2 family RNA-binding protein [Synechococcus sp. M16CYN]|uniref:Tab2/Atab2 family RNA-binding protein n=1 Tax=Synechococcus sp. M16CYN TaxID=3103139 RepID=UPI0032544AD4
MKTAKKKGADWELDFYSRPVLESDGHKRWELLITTTPLANDNVAPFRFAKICPSGEVNSLWLSKALSEARGQAIEAGFGEPACLRCWRSSMRTMVQRAAKEQNLEVISSRRTFALIDWLEQRAREVYPQEKGFMTGPLALPPALIPAPALPLPEEVQGEAWAWATLPASLLRDANDWPMSFSGLLPLPKGIKDQAQVPGLRLFSQTRSLAMAGWFGGLEPVRLIVEGRQLILEAGQDDRWLVSDLDGYTAQRVASELDACQEDVGGLQFIAIQSNPDEQAFAGFWMMRDIHIA